MLFVLFSWIFVFWLSLVFGKSFCRYFPSFRSIGFHFQSDKLTFTLLAGFLIASAISSCISLFLPINEWTQLGFGAVGLLLTIRYRQAISEELKLIWQRWRQAPLWFKASFLSLTLLTLLACISKIVHIDTGLYHAQTIQWIRSYAAVPGLGNLYGRLAFNSHFFIPSALFSLWFTEDLIVLPLNSFFYLVLVITLLDRIRRSLGKQNLGDLFLYLLLLMMFTYEYFPKNNSSCNDQIVGILVFYAIELYRWYLSKTNRNNFFIIFTWLIVCTVITYKLSAIFLGLLLFSALPQLRKSTWIPVALTGLLVIGPYFGRNLILSGHPLFPVPLLDLFNIGWEIPSEKVAMEKDYIECYAKYGYADDKPGSWTEIIDTVNEDPNWFRTWVSRLGFERSTVMLVNVLSLLAAALALRKRDFKILVIYLIIIANLAFWFFNAPTLRFVYGFLFYGFALTIGYLANAVWEFPEKLRKGFTSLLLPALIGMVLMRSDTFSYREWSSAQLLAPLKYTTVKTKDFDGFHTTLKVPRYGESCFNAPIPCTPYPDSTLRARGKTPGWGYQFKNE